MLTTLPLAGEQNRAYYWCEFGQLPREGSGPESTLGYTQPNVIEDKHAPLEHGALITMFPRLRGRGVSGEKGRFCILSTRHCTNLYANGTVAILASTPTLNHLQFSIPAGMGMFLGNAWRYLSAWSPKPLPFLRHICKSCVELRICLACPLSGYAKVCSSSTRWSSESSPIARKC